MELDNLLFIRSEPIKIPDNLRTTYPYLYVLTSSFTNDMPRAIQYDFSKCLNVYFGACGLSTEDFVVFGETPMDTFSDTWDYAVATKACIKYSHKEVLCRVWSSFNLKGSSAVARKSTYPNAVRYALSYDVDFEGIRKTKLIKYTLRDFVKDMDVYVRVLYNYDDPIKWFTDIYPKGAPTRDEVIAMLDGVREDSSVRATSFFE